MLTEDQIGRVWENMLSAETRSLYFADLASRFTVRKQWVTGVSFFLSSGAAATIIAKSAIWVPVVLAVIVALGNAYVMAINLDRKVATMAKLHSAWNSIAAEYYSLWNHTGDDDAEHRFDKVVEREKEPSELAAKEAPNDQKLIGKWQEQVFSSHHLI